ncbi:glycosyltransferase [Deinococcus frigens]|uniref:glycosyltransferase n=1 Tax=Deinococcus frigens TaxID=249403 RepID=UPI0009FBF2C8|nr:glycosyltransferase [Deinococcus frigens]
MSHSQASPHARVSAPQPPRPLRVLHLTGTLDRGGIETWLINLLSRVPRGEVAMDLLVASPDPRPGDYAARARELGAQVFVGPPTSNPLAFALFWLRTLRRGGPYDVVHSHIHHFGGLALWLARLAGVPVRISTSHSDTREGDSQATNGRYAYLTLMRMALSAGVTHRLAVSSEAAAALYGPDWARAGARLVTLGIDLDGVRTPVDAQHLRASLGLQAGVPVIGHVGQFRAQKNHLFLLEIFAAYLERCGPAQLVLVGDGPERQAIEARVQALGLTGSVHLLGSRPDVVRLLQAMDVFVFPSLFEGLSLALVEAQVAGLPCVVSDAVSGETRLKGAAYLSLPLDAAPVLWADAVSRALGLGRPVPDASAFDISERAAELMDDYRQAVGGRP